MIMYAGYFRINRIRCDLTRLHTYNIDNLSQRPDIFMQHFIGCETDLNITTILVLT